MMGPQVGSRIGDSGYISCTGVQNDILFLAKKELSSTESSFQYVQRNCVSTDFPARSVVEAQLLPHLLQGITNKVLKLIYSYSQVITHNQLNILVSETPDKMLFKRFFNSIVIKILSVAQL